MSDFLVVLLKIASMFLVMALGWVARKRALITDDAGRVLSRLLVDMIFPALVFTQMLRTVNPQVLRESWFVPILGAAVIVIAKVVGQLGMPLFRHKGALAPRYSWWRCRIGCSFPCRLWKGCLAMPACAMFCSAMLAPS